MRAGLPLCWRQGAQSFQAASACTQQKKLQLSTAADASMIMTYHVFQPTLLELRAT